MIYIYIYAYEQLYKHLWNAAVTVLAADERCCYVKVFVNVFVKMFVKVFVNVFVQVFVWRCGLADLN